MDFTFLFSGKYILNMHKILEFQAVVLAAGRGSRLPDVGGTVPKCLLPVGAYPVIWYSLNMLEKLGFQGKTAILAACNAKSIAEWPNLFEKILKTRD